MASACAQVQVQEYIKNEKLANTQRKHSQHPARSVNFLYRDGEAGLDWQGGRGAWAPL
ncbi:hypothetical protein FOQG_07710 [Fusarium oxysporum f. sp. raphani 54005]|uniref:Uncharacterized protein n=6 Tax=Fusarium oxysporum TaxID=5507 RepID=W9HXJ1_FUSOX|nr:hypothetical protein FOYG_12656 [Fusarium oxysporum NRRL 32931]EWZ35950.1 hypothetical protein FOZG_11732 [Fusarium oxysporum Fo47]EWZ96047.1 hypothetical protein FOWG_03551 [Fusarium oxysporum f. sp. lycopersici MN25]EXA38082.1 hypothetical protein FOVG_12081 [Fusarium oxysporum f. sp. pisi HDV247]EXK29894.1 hypothetical protein FOMG_13621 [Fusarium oxysporum f. sp. melonis 26406]EXK89622.1 hypothetical protein FOQG_07710 [Fusarium oxysporum f. sp. raphani 54005]EXL55494.1 hypothetical pr